MRPVGQRIILAMQLLEREGPCGYRVISDYMNFVQKENVAKYLSRAVGLGLATVDRSRGVKMFSAVDGWRDNLHQHSTTRSKPVKAVKDVVVHRAMVNSVWALGGM